MQPWPRSSSQELSKIIRRQRRRLKYKTKESFSQARRWLKSSQQVNGSKYWHNINETKSAKMLSTQKVWFLFRIVWFSHQWDSRVSRFFSLSLLVLDLEPFQFHFHFSKKSEGILFFTFHFLKKWKLSRFYSFFLEKKEWNQVRGIIILCIIYIAPLSFSSRLYFYWTQVWSLSSLVKNSLSH